MRGDLSGQRLHYVDYDWVVQMPALFCSGSWNSGTIQLVCHGGKQWNSQIKVNKTAPAPEEHRGEDGEGTGVRQVGHFFLEGGGHVDVRGGGLLYWCFAERLIVTIW